MHLAALNRFKHSAKPIQNCQNVGFTLVELLIVVGLIGVLTGALIPSFSNFIKGQNVRQAQEQLKSDLRNAQNKALTGTSSETGILYWGVYIPSGNTSTYSFFSSTNTVCDIATKTNVTAAAPLASGSVIKAASNLCIFFSLSNGDVSFGGSFAGCSAVGGFTGMTCINVADSSTATTCRQIGLNASGLIKGGNTSESCP